MPATGDVAQDLLAIREIVKTLPAAPHLREPWWGAPTTDLEIFAKANRVFGELPDDVVDFYRTTDRASFGCFDEIIGLDMATDRREDFSYAHNEQSQAHFPFLFEEDRPQSDSIFVMSATNDRGCLVEIGGPDHGRVIFPPTYGQYWRTLAWSLSDAIACIRDLYEAGLDWYRPQTDGHGNPVRAPEDLEFDRVQPIIDRWNCNPIIAFFPDDYCYTPDRPTSR